MKKIILIATKNKPEFAEMVADKIQNAADKENFSCEVSAISIVNLNNLQKIDADLILFVPPRFRELERVKKYSPNAKIDMIGMKDYAFMNSENILTQIKKILEVDDFGN